jgi:hypothetical protein
MKTAPVCLQKRYILEVYIRDPPYAKRNLPGIGIIKRRGLSPYWIEARTILLSE